MTSLTSRLFLQLFNVIIVVICYLTSYKTSLEFLEAQFGIMTMCLQNHMISDGNLT